ncbi:MAG: SRPBCC domain-containing protein [Anaerolineales bacterium]|nr:SRPBCC domain-containing protein [Anaerolineales bacterium]QYK51516.1 MAG: SRPBCC domain-containing protein [Anaerolineales bacterium]
MTESNPPATEDLVVRRIVNAPLEVAWRAWSTPEQMRRWWGPQHYTCPVCEMDFREGGRTLVSMRAPDGAEHYSLIEYTRIIPNERIEYIHNLADASGARIAPESIGMPADFPQDQRTLVTFRALGSFTELTITEYGLPVSPFRVYAALGLHEMADKITEAAENP